MNQKIKSLINRCTEYKCIFENIFHLTLWVVFHIYQQTASKKTVILEDKTVFDEELFEIVLW